MSRSGLIDGKPKLADSSYHITIMSWPGKEITVVTKGIPVKTVLPVTASFPHTTSTRAFAGSGAGVEAMPCLDLYVFLLSILRTYVSDLWHGKWQSNTLSNAREQAGKAAIIPKMSHSRAWEQAA